jgi:deoxycytidine triphosphate deaminase
LPKPSAFGTGRFLAKPLASVWKSAYLANSRKIRVGQFLSDRLRYSVSNNVVEMLELSCMAKILSDREIKTLLLNVIEHGDTNLVNPNGIELRLGNHIRFLSTGEDKELHAGQFLKVSPGETVLISSFERIDFSSQTVRQHFKECMLMGLISPTTTMMREGISQVTTKIDAGFRGHLNWSLRNSSSKDLILQHGEPIYKLTIFKLEKDESPGVIKSG